MSSDFLKIWDIKVQIFYWKFFFLQFNHHPKGNARLTFTPPSRPRRTQWTSKSGNSFRIFSGLRQSGWARTWPCPETTSSFKTSRTDFWSRTSWTSRWARRRTGRTRRKWRWSTKTQSTSEQKVKLREKSELMLLEK